MLRILTIGRSLSGIYHELRQLRRLAESYFVAADIPLPKTPYQRLKDRVKEVVTESGLGLDYELEPEVELSEEELARKRVAEIVTDLSEGKDPGTSYRPWY